MATRLDYSRRSYYDVKVRQFTAKKYDVYMNVSYNADGIFGTKNKRNEIYVVYFEEGKTHYFNSKEQANKLFDMKVQQLKNLLS